MTTTKINEITHAVIGAAYSDMKSVPLLLSILVCAVTSVGQTHFYLEESFKHPVRIPAGVVSLLNDEVGKACSQETANGGTDVKAWFSASRISVNDNRSALILQSSKDCLNGADNVWFWVFLKTAQGYRLVLTGGAISVDVLRSKTHGLRDIETNVATARTNHMDIYKFNGSAYHARRCTEATPVDAKPKRVPCRTR